MPTPPTSPLGQAIAALANRQSLSERHTTEVFGAVMRGEATPTQIAALLMGLRVKGETVEEVAGAAPPPRGAPGGGGAARAPPAGTRGARGGAGPPVHTPPAAGGGAAARGPP